jgi:hypothetical protein
MRRTSINKAHVHWLRSLIFQWYYTVIKTTIEHFHLQEQIKGRNSLFYTKYSWLRYIFDQDWWLTDCEVINVNYSNVSRYSVLFQGS